MSLTDWDAVSSPIVEAADTITALRAEVERLTAENFSLAAWQCEFTDGKTGLVASEGGSTYCAMAREVDAVRAANRDVMLHWEALKADHDRLRAALEDVVHGWETPMEDNAWRAVAQFMWDKARAALTKAGET